MGVGRFYKFDPGIVRGLAYYTGIVFEVHAVGGELRAICGGGRYDNLLKDFGGPDIPAVGMGFGDCVLEILLREKGLLDKHIKKPELDYFVVSDKSFEENIFFDLVAKLRRNGFITDFSYKTDNLSKQLKTASEKNAKKCIIISKEYSDSKQIIVKDMATGEQQTIPIDKFMDGLINSK
jgi:histidyl-tRNA synthetase